MLDVYACVAFNPFWLQLQERDGPANGILEQINRANVVAVHEPGMTIANRLANPLKLCGLARAG